MLSGLAEATRSAEAFSAASSPPEDTVASVSACLRKVLAQRDRLAALLAVRPDDDPGAWQQHGALLAGVDRLRVEVASAVHPRPDDWRPVPVVQVPREAVRRAVTAPRRRTRPGRRR